MSIPQTPSPLSNILAAKTYNAAWFSGSTKELQITAAIAAAVLDGALYVYVPASMLPYTSSSVTFNSAVKMLAEGGNSSEYDIKAYGASDDGVTDCSSAINTAIQHAKSKGSAYVVISSNGSTYAIASTILVDGVGVTLESGAAGAFFDGPTLKWTGATGTSIVMVKVTNTSHGAGVKGITLDANFKAGICLQVVDDGAGGSTATFAPVISNITFKGYTSRGLVMGLDIDINAPVQCTMQMGTVVAPNLRWLGGSANAIGLMINAQNLEKFILIGPYFDPSTGLGYSNHKHHVYSYRGGFHLISPITTRADDYAVVSAEGFGIDNWNAEDRYLLKTLSADMSGPAFVRGLRQRTGASNVFSDITIDLLGSVHEMEIDGTVQQSIRIGATDVRIGRMFVNFALSGAGADFIFSGPGNQRGIFHNLSTGVIRLRGTGATQALILTKEDGTAVMQITPNGVTLPAFTTGTKPAAGAVTAGTIIYVSDGGAGAVFQGSNGAAWVNLG